LTVGIRIRTRARIKDKDKDKDEEDGKTLVGYSTVRVRVAVRVAPEAEAVMASVEMPAGVPVMTVGDAFVQELAVMAKRIAIENASTGAFVFMGRHQRQVVDRIISTSVKAS